MYEIWSYLVLLMLYALVGGFIWFVLVIIGKAVFEDFLARVFKKMKRKREIEEDYYIY